MDQVLDAAPAAVGRAALVLIWDHHFSLSCFSPWDKMYKSLKVAAAEAPVRLRRKFTSSLSCGFAAGIHIEFARRLTTSAVGADFGLRIVWKTISSSFGAQWSQMNSVNSNQNLSILCFLLQILFVFIEHVDEPIFIV